MLFGFSLYIQPPVAKCTEVKMTYRVPHNIVYKQLIAHHPTLMDSTVRTADCGFFPCCFYKIYIKEEHGPQLSEVASYTT